MHLIYFKPLISVIVLYHDQVCACFFRFRCQDDAGYLPGDNVWKIIKSGLRIHVISVEKTNTHCRNLDASFRT